MFTLLEFGFYVFALTFVHCVCIENEVMIAHVVSKGTAFKINGGSRSGTHYSSKCSAGGQAASVYRL